MTLKILILCSYYNRPLLVRNALRSILDANEFHPNWELAFLDDGSLVAGRPIVEEILKCHLDKITIVRSEMSFKDKVEHGLLLGQHANCHMKKSNADVAIILCDDDELFPTYLRDLSLYFSQNTDVLYCYSKVHLFNPIFQKSIDINNLSGKYNQWNIPIEPAGKVDASQVAWRLDCCKKHNAWFEESTKFVEGKPWTRDTDRGFFENLYNRCGLCFPTGFIAQYKAIHDYQLLWHKNVAENSLLLYDNMCRELAGVKF